MRYLRGLSGFDVEKVRRHSRGQLPLTWRSCGVRINYVATNHRERDDNRVIKIAGGIALKIAGIVTTRLHNPQKARGAQHDVPARCEGPQCGNVL